MPPSSPQAAAKVANRTSGRRDLARGAITAAVFSHRRRGVTGGDCLTSVLSLLRALFVALFKPFATPGLRAARGRLLSWQPAAGFGCQAPAPWWRARCSNASARARPPSLRVRRAVANRRRPSRVTARANACRCLRASASSVIVVSTSVAAAPGAARHPGGTRPGNWRASAPRSATRSPYAVCLQFVHDNSLTIDPPRRTLDVLTAKT